MRGVARNGIELEVGDVVGFTVSRLLCDTPLILTVTVAVVRVTTDDVVTGN